ncbi:MAG: hypothetical protein ACKVU4_08155 [Phycisphaerales bacterium]
MSDPKQRKGNVWCAGCLTDHLLAAGKPKAQRVLIRVVRHDFRVKQGLCRACGKKRLTIDLGGRKKKGGSKPPSAG